MQWNNEKEMNSCLNPSSLSTTSSNNSCSTSSTDSGVILIDNSAAFMCKSSDNGKGNDNDSDVNVNEFNKRNNKNKNSNFATDTTTTTTTTITPTHTAKDKLNEETKAFQQKQKINNQHKNNINRNSNGSIINIEHTVRISNDFQQQQQNGLNNNNKISSTTTSKNGSPTLSIRSAISSIISIDENAEDSSVIDSDSANETDNENNESNNYVIKKIGQPTIYTPKNTGDIPNINNGLKVISQQIQPNGQSLVPPKPGIGNLSLAENFLTGNIATPSPTASTPQIGRIELTNTSDVTFGDKHFYEGPVTIQQFLIDSRDKWQTVNAEEGQENPAYSQSDGSLAAGLKKREEPKETIKRVISQKTVIITGVFVFITILAGTLLALTTNIFETEVNKSKQLGDGDDSRKNIPINSTIEYDNIGGGRILRVVPRDAWLAQPPETQLVSLKLPVSQVIIMPTQTDDCTTQAECTFRVRFLQTFHIESLHQDDIIYNFLIGADGNVYEGRGWERAGAHIKGHNTDSVSFAFIGTYRKDPPSDKQISITKLLLNDGLKNGHIAKNYKLTSAISLDPSSSQLKAPMLYETFKKWPHWSE